MTESEESLDYDSGPFCEHWCDPVDCDEICVTCGVKCCHHEYNDEACDEFVTEDDNNLLA